MVKYTCNEGGDTLAEATEKYRDRLFCFIFGSEEHKDWTLSLYNAVNNTAYTDSSMIIWECRMMWLC